MNIQEIKKLIPHRYPFLLIDRILHLSKESIVALKNITYNEAFFQGHFPDKPVMPGVLIIEAIAQAGAILAMKNAKINSNNPLFYLASIESAKFKNPVIPGDSLKIEVRYLKGKMNLWKMKGEVLIDENLAAEVEFSAMLKV